tara:strand:- start:194 stop:448 length:255 start_codon:yes stop_codon:yes gene_type:complete
LELLRFFQEPDFLSTFFLFFFLSFFFKIEGPCKKYWIGNSSLFSVCYLPDEIQDYQLREIEDDLIGAYYSKNNEIPKYQFAGKQ